MRIILGYLVALAIVGATLASTAVRADDGYEGRYRSTATVSFGADDIAFGYRDGYWDNGHIWHYWHDRRAYLDYRFDHPDAYSDRNHNRDNDDTAAGRVR
jgi:hypothetical protein